MVISTIHTQLTNVKCDYDMETKIADDIIFIRFPFEVSDTARCTVYITVESLYLILSHDSMLSSCVCLSIRLSVRPSVRHKPILYQTV